MRNSLLTFLFAIALVPNLAFGALTDNLVSYWNMDESSGTRFDSVASNDLTDNNTVGNGTGIVDLGADFISANNEFFTSQINGMVDINAFSIALWVNTATEDERALLSIDQGGLNAGDFNLFLWPSFFKFLFDTGASQPTIESSTTVTDGAFHYIVITSDGSTVGMYIDGNSTPEDTMANTTNLNIDNVVWHIGEAFNGNSNIDGIVDEFGLWDRALSTDEIAELYNSGDGLAYPFTGDEGGEEVGLATSTIGTSTAPYITEVYYGIIIWLLSAGCVIWLTRKFI